MTVRKCQNRVRDLGLDWNQKRIGGNRKITESSSGRRHARFVNYTSVSSSTLANLIYSLMSRSENAGLLPLISEHYDIP